ncbi:MAG: A24 family peptidase [Candidatus Saccharimonadales bacterium]|nr:A24 family peptidase [Candidatus Saccharimonadales bacterium]
MAAAFGLSYAYWPLEFDAFGWIHLIIWLALLVGLVTLLVYDLRWLMLPNVIIYPMILAALGLATIEATIFDGGPEVVRDWVVGLFIIGGFFYTLFSFSNGKWIGGGDVKLAFFIGIFQGLARGIVAVYAGFVAASVVIVPLLIAKKVTRKSAVPFGPFLILGIFVAELWGQDIIDWYNNTFLLGTLD